MRKITKRVGIIAAVCALAVGGGIAWAAWTVNGEATATATATTGVKFTITAEVTELLYPGNTSDVKVKAENPNPFKVKVNNLVGAPVITVDKADCAITNLQVLPAALTTNLTLVPDYSEQTVANAVKMIDDPQDACQGAKFTIKANVQGVSVSP